VVCNAVGSETVIGSTLGSSIDHSEVIVMEFANLPTTSCVDTSNTTGSGNSTSLVSNSITPSANQEMLVGLFCYNGAPTFTIGTNVPWIYNSAKMLNSYAPNVSTSGAYYFQPTAAALTANGTIGVSTNWNALIVALK
jgi:hypothetical protein